MMGTRAGTWGELEALKTESAGVRMSAGGKGGGEDVSKKQTQNQTWAFW